ncbi:hypothetical protein GCM10009846_11380 [Agrococcus versicolor]|uniref:Lytic transglycosylase domain-containing protein n=1 Tax=Agrococcus versicolor TaxID=501482 RepID=A0ABN3ANY7_9MICO
MFSRTDASSRRARTRGVVSILALVAASGFVAVSIVDPSVATYAESGGLESENLLGQGVDEVSGSGDSVTRDDLVVESPTPTPTPTPTPSAAPAAAGATASGSAPSIPLPTVAAPDPGSAQAVARDMVLARGWGDDQYQCLYSLWQRESGWNVYAQNVSSGAYGIPQALPGSKMATAGADWQTNAATQISWGLGYIAGRYGTPCGAWGHSESVGWY